MAPSFLSDLRRRSKASFRTDESVEIASNANSHSNSSSNGYSNASTSSHAHPSAALTPSSSSVNLPFGTPPAMSSSNSNSATNLQAMAAVNGQANGGAGANGNGSAARPNGAPSLTSRHSVSGMAGLGAPNTSLPTSQYAPRILSIADNAWAYQKVLLVYGVIADPATQALEGTLTVTRLDDDFPPTSWPVSESHFKALVYLTPGPNRLRFDFASPKLANSNTSNPIHSSYLTIHMLPALSAPPLHLVVLVGKDSPATFDAVPPRVEREGNGLDTAVRKLRMAAYLWQAFTAEQMVRNKLGRRVFRIEEEWVTGTSNYRDRELGTMRSEARVHVVRSSKTVAELRDPNRAQQNPKATDKDGLLGIAAADLREYFKPLPGQKLYVTALILDAHWDKGANLITGHAAVQCQMEELSLSVFGSHALQSYPASFEEVVPAFSDCTPTDTDYVANDSGESGSSWEAANVGIGAHLHEVGHVFGCPHQENGIMLRDFVTLNRTFTIREPYATRTRSRGGLVLPKDECTWHRLDCLRFRAHPCFALPTDPPRATDESIHVWPVENGNAVVTAPSGVSFLEIFTEGDDLCRHWLEFGDGNGGGPVQKQVLVTEQDLRGRLPDAKRKSRLKICVHSWAGGRHEVPDFGLLTSKVSRIKLPNGQAAYRSSRLGSSQMDGSRPEEVVLHSATGPALLTQVRVYHGFAFDGIEFVYEDGNTQLFGKKGGDGAGSEFNFDTRRGEHILGFYVRSGFWVDGLSIITSLGRKSPFFGNATGGSGHTLIPPRGYSIAGVTGSCANWVDGFGVLLAR